ncbi:hypothetical protein [Actinoplanes awajinensis]|uniref:hypothetical protein n=1 Tax=Actinoplanes awajinensis TaxID=135946 RepID=UPI000A9EE594|nr:hypothetical protein [Actinoplanes awajinensis]
MTQPLSGLPDEQLAELARGRGSQRAPAVLELITRAGRDEIADLLGELSRLPLLREDRLFHLVSVAWAAIIGLLAAETPHAREVAYAAYADLPQRDQELLLIYLHAGRIEDAHPVLD